MAMFPALMNDSIFSDLFDDPFFAGWRGSRGNNAAKAEGSSLMPIMGSELMSTDVKDNGDSYDVDIDMPGFDKDNIKIQLDNGYLTVSAHREENHSEGDQSTTDRSGDGASAGNTENARTDTGDDSGRWLRRERYIGSCSRSFYVGSDVKESDIHAKYQNGTLCLQIPKNTAPQVEQAHTIAIES
ncbi:Hsp20/alpha crystallin family protein [Bifidobacterium psychraerophilum]|jgi:HSP20 family molecular chaperone IbpA|uniref:Hsp20 n=1 Tax=Bifidobacterium psychraerophilum TaxID=218140 RepID=A0A087CFZ1_9BIFI|nr:Hsp20/alpha crystallin family protein [Bifidobacterium psychraerophilum]KFI82191.1 Hsp20 [Bifidobacterium psychraerophilum]PKA94995.1 heat shock protein Hsp20 [Bifidobacterium psychraerophilum DSM 22366]